MSLLPFGGLHGLDGCCGAKLQQAGRLISHQPAVLFSHNKPATSNQPAVLFSQNKPAPAIIHQPTEQAAFYSTKLLGYG
jgi:hypothetical protein